MRIDIPISGFNTAVRRQDFRANNIANLNTPGYQAKDAAPEEVSGGGVRLGPARASDAPTSAEGSNVDLVTEETGSILDVRSAQANAHVIRAEDALLGETLNLIA